MRYLFQRIVHNDHRWKSPSGGRLNSVFDKGYVSEHGFAHEDWNFSRKQEIGGGHSWGYCYYQPKSPEGAFSIAFATYEGDGIWSLAGLYENAVYDPLGASFSEDTLSERAQQIHKLQRSGQIGGEYDIPSLRAIKALLADEQQHYRWKLHVDHIVQLDFSITIPSELLPSVGYHFSRPTELTNKQYEGIKNYIKSYLSRPTAVDFEDGGDIEFPEGGRTQKEHYRLERNPAVVKIAKANFLRKHGRFFCEICSFDFATTYGSIGKTFIEAHHTVPVCEMPPGATTKPGDMILLCSNCHRMVHRIRPWQGSVNKLKALMTSLKND
ncbi:HNH endonuclease [Rhizobium sp. WSM1325]|uniref:HNH endonuclease n=1 Tax=Rhizobium sp. WSM1325 TaxID=3444086 RepID=UPI0013E2DD30|nr:HNH endonuclease [Rhizobium leguminosarum]